MTAVKIGTSRQIIIPKKAFEELGLASADIQLVMLGCPYSYGRVLGGTWKALVGQPLSPVHSHCGGEVKERDLRLESGV